MTGAPIIVNGAKIHLVAADATGAAPFVWDPLTTVRVGQEVSQGREREKERDSRTHLKIEGYLRFLTPAVEMRFPNFA